MKKVLVLVLLLSFFTLNFLSAQRESLTYDEPVHLKAGLEEWQKRDFSMDANNPPLIREIAALPVVLGIAPGRQYLPSRLTITLLGLILALVVFKYAAKKFGWQTGLIALLLFVFEPSILANSHYLTLDIGTTLFFVLAYLSFLKFLDKTSVKTTLIWGLFSGLAFASKVTIVPVLLLSFFVLALWKKKLWQKNFLKKSFLGAGVAIVAIWAVYFFTLAPVVAEREDPTRLSEKILVFAQVRNYQFLKDIIFFLKLRPIPLGYYLATLKNGLVFNLSSHRIDFLGRFYPDNRFYFLPTLLALKLPISLLLLFFCGLLRGVKEKKKEIFLLLIPVLVMLLIFSFGHFPPRVRYLLPVYPFLIMMAALGADWLSKKHFGKVILGILLVWYFIGTIFSFPHFISYANEIAGPRQTRIFLFSDSNYDWGQGLFDLKKYVEENNIASVGLSYCGTDNPAEYGLAADRPFAERFEDRCPLYQIKLKEEGKKIIAISLTNYYYCGYYQQSEFSKDKVSEIVGDSILIFK